MPSTRARGGLVVFVPKSLEAWIPLGSLVQARTKQTVNVYKGSMLGTMLGSLKPTPSLVRLHGWGSSPSQGGCGE